MSWVNTKCAVESINDGDVLGIFLYGYDLVRLQPENGYTRMMHVSAPVVSQEMQNNFRT